MVVLFWVNIHYLKGFILGNMYEYCEKYDSQSVCFFASIFYFFSAKSLFFFKNGCLALPCGSKNQLI